MLIPKLAAHEWLLSVNGEVRYAVNTNRSNGRFRNAVVHRRGKSPARGLRNMRKLMELCLYEPFAHVNICLIDAAKITSCRDSVVFLLLNLCHKRGTHERG